MTKVYGSVMEGGLWIVDGWAGFFSLLMNTDERA